MPSNVGQFTIVLRGLSLNIFLRVVNLLNEKPKCQIIVDLVGNEDTILPNIEKQKETLYGGEAIPKLVPTLNDIAIDITTHREREI